jgi:hypothetical protein
MEKITFIFNDLEGCHDEVAFPLPDREESTIMRLHLAAADHFSDDMEHGMKLSRDIGELLNALVEWEWDAHFLHTDILVGYKVEEDESATPDDTSEMEEPKAILIPGRADAIRVSQGFKVVHSGGKTDDITVTFLVELENSSGAVRSPLVHSVSRCPAGVSIRDQINAWARRHLNLQEGEDACKGFPEHIK